MNSHLTPQKVALGVVYLRNSRAIPCDIRLDGHILRRNLFRPELITTSPVDRLRQDGYLLLETLITIGILAVGLLGISAMQLASLKSSYSALQRGEAAIIIASMSDRMRANTPAFTNKATVAEIEYNLRPSGSRAKQDIETWETQIESTFGVSSSGASLASGNVNCISAANCILQIQWNDPGTDAALNPDGKEYVSSSDYRYQHLVSILF